MARPQKQTVDYFPHMVGDSKTRFVLENRYGNDGYAFWFKLLELLCKSDGHFYNCNGVAEWEYLIAFAKVPEEVAIAILDKLSEMGNIDRKLWECKVIWCQSLVDNVADAYKKRTVSPPKKPNVERFPVRKPEQTDISGDGNPQSILNNTKEDIEDDEERVREGKVFEFFNLNIGPISPYQAETLSQHLDEGLEPQMVIAVLKDSVGKDDKWSWIKTVLQNSAAQNVKTAEQYEAKKVEKKARDKPQNKGKPPQNGNFDQRKYSDADIDKIYKDVGG